jgi:hypothetical protein
MKARGTRLGLQAALLWTRRYSEYPQLKYIFPGMWRSLDPKLGGGLALLILP